MEASSNKKFQFVLDPEGVTKKETLEPKCTLQTLLNYVCKRYNILPKDFTMSFQIKKTGEEKRLI